MNKTFVLALIACAALCAKDAKQEKPPELSPLDRYVQEALRRPEGTAAAAPGSLWSPASRLNDIGSDLRAGQVDDLVTILVVERASAVSRGATKTSRKSSVNSSISALAGIPSPVGALTNLATAGSNSELDGEGATSRETTLSTTMTARVTHVLPNGYMVVEGVKDLQVNSERQLITVRGVVRPVDLTPGNLVRSDRLAQLEVRINGKGVVGDAIRRPFFLYRILLGLLPF
jgi:flagellar L-ring protein precursor FlgH